MSVSSGYTEQELLRVWTLPESLQRRLLRPALARLYESNASENYLTEWTTTLRESVQMVVKHEVPYTIRNTPRGGHERFVNLCLEAGLADAMLKVADLPTLTSKRAKLHALSVWYYIVEHAATDHAAAASLKDSQTYAKGVLLRSLRSDLFMQRMLAVRCIRVYAWGPWGKLLPNDDISDLMMECLSYAHGDHQTIIDDLKSKQFSWQREIMMHEAQTHTLSVETASELESQLWSSSRDDALDAASRLLSTRNRSTFRRDCLEILEREPQILSQLLIIIALFEQPTWHPDAMADSTAAHTLAHLLMPPHLWIPELSETSFPPSHNHFPPGRTADNDETMAEWHAAVSCWNIFVEQRNWKSMLLKKWNKLQTEMPEDALSKFHQRLRTEGHGTKVANLLEAVYDRRGECRSCILRIFINLTYGKTSDDPILPSNILFSLLPTAYEASQKVPSEARVARSKRHADSVAGQRVALLRRERFIPVFKTSSGADGIQQRSASLVLPAEYILGPVLLFRIMCRVYDTFGTDIVSWTSLPENTLPNDHLGRVQQIASADVLGIVMRNVVLRRIPTQKIVGSKQIEAKVGADGSHYADLARSSYLAAAELAMAVEKFYASAGPEKAEWEDLMPLVKKELVASLGNASLMSSRLDQFHLAWWYAKHALANLETVDQAAAKRDGWDPAGMRDKNKMRLEAAEAKIKAHG